MVCHYIARRLHVHGSCAHVVQVGGRVMAIGLTVSSPMPAIDNMTIRWQQDDNKMATRWRDRWRAVRCQNTWFLVWEILFLCPRSHSYMFKFGTCMASSTAPNNHTTGTQEVNEAGEWSTCVTGRDRWWLVGGVGGLTEVGMDSSFDGSKGTSYTPFTYMVLSIVGFSVIPTRTGCTAAKALGFCGHPVRYYKHVVCT